MKKPPTISDKALAAVDSERRTVREVFALSPTELRRRVGVIPWGVWAEDAAPADENELQLRDERKAPARDRRSRSDRRYHDGRNATPPRSEVKPRFPQATTIIVRPSVAVRLLGDAHRDRPVRRRRRGAR